MVEHWKTNGPPVYMAVAGYLGLIKTDKKATSSGGSSQEYGNLEELARMFEGTGGMIQ